ncbi:MAG TPA: peptidylprolyl isomerase [Terriglobia bacterium]|nr:peptidylprolyl isomerase [Terriglobia bacterium]
MSDNTNDKPFMSGKQQVPNSVPRSSDQERSSHAHSAKLEQPPGLYASIETSLGRIVCRLFPERAPLAVQNFVELAQGKKKWYNEAERKWEERPYYNGLTFHRVIPDFMIQGGDYRGNGAGRVGYSFKDEFSPDLKFSRPGLLAMANAGPNTNGGQFFITVASTPWLNQKHSIFGEVVEGQDIADSISKTERDARDRPLRPVILTKVEIMEQRG